MKSTINRMIARFMLILCLTGGIQAVYPSVVYAQDLSEVNDGLEDAKDEIVEIADTIMTIFLIIAFVFMIVTFVTNVANQKTGVLTFVGVLILYGLFQAIFA